MIQDKTEKARVVAEGILAYLRHDQALNLLPEIIIQLQKSTDKKANQIQVESAVELSQTEKDTILKNLQNKYAWNGDIVFSINREILGGLKITYGDKTIDLSIIGKLNSIYENI
jgi:F-type H+-transporting ATPase subunit delta